jgi:hypothetical protein
MPLPDGIIEKLMDRVMPEPNSGCWLWTGALTNGYGIADPGKGHSRRVHRIFYAHFVGEIPDGLCLDHLCRVRCCVNPAHLEPVTNRENVRRGIAAVGLSSLHRGQVNAAKSFCPKGHEYSSENTEFRKFGNGLKRRCRECHRIASLSAYRKRNDGKAKENFSGRFRGASLPLCDDGKPSASFLRQAALG